MERSRCLRSARKCCWSGRWRFIKSILPTQPEGRAYLAGRGIAEASQWERHGVGYCNGKLPELLPNDERVRGELKTLGLLLPDGRERFAGCVVFPVRDAEGRLTTIYGRRCCRQHAERKSAPLFAGATDGLVERGGVENARARCPGRIRH